MNKLLKTLVAVIVLITALAVPCSALGSVDYVIGIDGKKVSVPQTHRVFNITRALGPEGGQMTEPSDLFIDKQDNIYVADKGNNRIVKLDSSCNYVASFDCEGTLNKPGGVFVSDNGHIYIADTLNERIVHISAEGEKIEEFVKPESELIEDDATFQIGRLGITSQGYIYTVKGQYFMMIDANNEFKGYVGDNRLGFSLKRLLIRTFASKEQQDRLIKENPPAYSSFDIGDDGLVYAVTGEHTETNQIQKINMVGDNIFPEKAYGEKYFDKEKNRMFNPRFVDICVDKNGIIYAIDGINCNIYVYDQEGNMLTVFGGKGNIKGKFDVPVALDTMSNGNLLVLDQSTGYIHCFERTHFMNAITEAVNCYNDGEYKKAEKAWHQVLEIDANYPVANKGIGDALYKQKEIGKAMKYYRLADSKGGYGMAFSIFQYSFFKQYFGWVVLAAVVIITVAVLIVTQLKKKSDSIVEDYYSGGKRHE